MPATPPIVITEPIRPLCQPWARRNTPRNGPMPACMSAMKKFRDCKGQMPDSPRRLDPECGLCSIRSPRPGRMNARGSRIVPHVVGPFWVIVRRGTCFAQSAVELDVELDEIAGGVPAENLE